MTFDRWTQHSSRHLNHYLLPALFASAISLSPTVYAQVTAQQQSASEQNIIAPKSTESAAIETANTVPIVADDGQLPAYLNASGTGSDIVVPDPWEHYNRHIYRFNKAIDTAIARPIARTYVRVTPMPVRTGIQHFFFNLQQPSTSLNLLLQGHPTASAKSLGRFALNSTVGIAGLFDPASRVKLPRYNEDFGQTFAHWGWHHSRYLLLPLLGPGTLRDRVGSAAGAPLNPLLAIQSTAVSAGLAGLSLVDTRAKLLPLDDLGAGSADEYALVRDAWAQHRDYTISHSGADVDAGSSAQ